MSSSVTLYTSRCSAVMRRDPQPSKLVLERFRLAKTRKRVALDIANERNDLCVSLAVDGCPVCEVGESFCEKSDSLQSSSGST